MKRIHFAYLLAAVLALTACQGNPSAYKEAGRSAEVRAEALLKKMTVDEKLGQLLCPLGWPMYDKVSADSVTISDQYRDFIQHQHGGMLWATFRADPWTKKTLETGLDPALAAKAYNALQHYAVDSTRLGIPILLAEEAPHGHMAIGTTVFPTGIGLASTWDKELVEEVGRTIGTELRAQGGLIGYGPVIDLSREPRWSRVEETFGEDVCLTSEMAAAMVRGTAAQGVISTLKHFVAYGVPEGGHNGNPSIIGMRDLQENVLPTFMRAEESNGVQMPVAETLEPMRCLNRPSVASSPCADTKIRSRFPHITRIIQPRKVSLNVASLSVPVMRVNLKSSLPSSSSEIVVSIGDGGSPWAMNRQLAHRAMPFPFLSARSAPSKLAVSPCEMRCAVTSFALQYTITAPLASSTAKMRRLASVSSRA